LVRLFKQLSIPSFLLLLVYAFLVHLNLLIVPTVWDSTVTGTLLYQWMAQGIDWLTFGNYYAQVGLFLFFLVMQAMMLNRLINQNEITPRRNLLAAMTYVLFIAFFNKSLFLSPAFLAAFPVIISLGQLFKAFSNKRLSFLFDAGFFIGVATLLFPPAFFMIMGVILTMLITRVFEWREWVVVPLGLFLPFYFMGIGLAFVPYETLVNHFYYWLPLPQLLNFGHLLTIKGGLRILFFIGVTMVNLWFFRFMYLKIPIRTRKLLSKSVYYLTAALGIFLLFNTVANGPFILLAIPLSLLSAFLISQYEKELYMEIIHLVVLIGLVFVQFMY